MKQIIVRYRYGLWHAVLYRDGKPHRYGKPAHSWAESMRGVL